MRHYAASRLIKDWMPGFYQEVTELYRDGSIELAEEAEREGHVWVIPRMLSVGEVVQHGNPDQPVLSYTESPIEAKMAAGFLNVIGCNEFVRIASFHGIADLTAKEVIARCWVEHEDDPERRVFVYPQVKIGRYRVDFFVVQLLDDLAHARVAVECDGREYHTSAEHVRRDFARDQYLRSEGYRVVRFTGSEIWFDADDCARSVVAAACAIFLPHRGRA